MIVNFLWQAEIELGDGLPDIRLTTQCIEALKQAGFEVSDRFVYVIYYVLCDLSLYNLIYNVLHPLVKVLFEKDLTIGSPLPWYLPLDKSHFSLSSFRLTALGRFITKNMVSPQFCATPFSLIFQPLSGILSKYVFFWLNASFHFPSHHIEAKFSFTNFLHIYWVESVCVITLCPDRLWP